MIKFPWFWQHLNTSYNPMMPRIVKQYPLESKEIKPVNVKENQPWILIWRTDAEAETPVFWSSDVNSQLIGKLPTSGEERAEGEEGVRGWNGWMASLRQWTWTWANFGRWWGTQSPGVLQSMESQRVRHDWATEQQQLLLVSLDLKMVVLLNWLCQRLWLRRSQQTVENS